MKAVNKKSTCIDANKQSQFTSKETITKQSVWIDANRQPQFTTWVIDTNSKEGHKLIGRYWHFGNVPFGIPEHMEGCNSAMFKTRQLARKNLPSVKMSFPNATVRKAGVIIIL